MLLLKFLIFNKSKSSKQFSHEILQALKFMVGSLLFSDYVTNLGTAVYNRWPPYHLDQTQKTLAEYNKCFCGCTHLGEQHLTKIFCTEIFSSRFIEQRSVHLQCILWYFEDMDKCWFNMYLSDFAIAHLTGPRSEKSFSVMIYWKVSFCFCLNKMIDILQTRFSRKSEEIKSLFNLKTYVGAREKSSSAC